MAGEVCAVCAGEMNAKVVQALRDLAVPGHVCPQCLGKDPIGAMRALGYHPPHKSPLLVMPEVK